MDTMFRSISSITRAFTAPIDPVPSGSSWRVRADLSTSPLAVLRRTDGPSRVSSRSSLLERLTLPTR
eukprot:10471678-Heterocapsa_arctica.AAC.1